MGTESEPGPKRPHIMIPLIIAVMLTPGGMVALDLITKGKLFSDKERPVARVADAIKIAVVIAFLFGQEDVSMNIAAGVIALILEFIVLGMVGRRS